MKFQYSGGFLKVRDSLKAIKCARNRKNHTIVRSSLYSYVELRHSYLNDNFFLEQSVITHEKAVIELQNRKFIEFLHFRSKMTISVHWPALAGIIHPNIGGWAGAYITRKNLNPWYESLKKPTWTPPKWAFGPVWTGIYCSMGYASYMVYRDGGGFNGAALPLSIYGANLALNWAWTPIFFGYHNIKLAFYGIVALWGTTAALAVAFYGVNPAAGYLILPYLAWNTLATALNYVIYRDNKETPALEEKKN